MDGFAQAQKGKMMSDLISRQAAIDALGERPMVWVGSDYELGARNQYDADVLALETVPSAQPEPAIPLQWIEAQIEWLKSLDNAFSTLTAGQISAMVNKWEDEQDG